MPERSLTLSSPDATCRLARRFAPRLGPGDIVLLGGGVGAGKTHFARCLVQASLDVPEDVPSPTYTLVQTYPGRQGDIWHADLYRLTDVGELDELGLQEAFASAICLIEWPDRLGEDVPETALTLTLSASEDDERTRLVRIGWSDPRWDDIVAGVTDG